ncbi:Integrase core domain protein [Enhygromyxa salina]|uniref:Integrase core domain protein n=1 Tax=Enhygromyxa salina TaxID=215803 RepID=A0A2S9XK01_9BACT|nr:DDE-type integrase/transposase/recombinase [Enhygromyxa salina]PRP93204.1 Integrase core domain protein [Enhygromyxa salina]
MQRRVRDWRALHGPDKEVYFEQVHAPGEEAELDFTNCNELGVTIAGEPFRHLLFELVLVANIWTWACVAFSESFEALVEGLQRALWALGGEPKQLTLDNMSAATHELKKDPTTTTPRESRRTRVRKSRTGRNNRRQSEK